MQSLNLEKFGVQEMNAKEMRETDGGLNPWVGFLVGYVLVGSSIKS